MTAEPVNREALALKPCPFCGPKSDLVFSQPCSDGGFGVTCRNCHTTMDVRSLDLDSVVAAWNSRPESVGASEPVAWQDINTAPKDGTEVDIWVTGPGSRRVENCRWGVPTGANWGDRYGEIPTDPQWITRAGFSLDRRNGVASHWMLAASAGPSATPPPPTEASPADKGGEADPIEALAAALYNLNPCGEQPTDADGRPLGPGGAIPWSAMDEYDPKVAQQVRRQAQAIADLEQSDWSALEDDISDAINDSLDMDWSSRDGAKAVVRLMNELRCPPPPIPSSIHQPSYESGYAQGAFDEAQGGAVTPSSTGGEEISVARAAELKEIAAWHERQAESDDDNAARDDEQAAEWAAHDDPMKRDRERGSRINAEHTRRSAEKHRAWAKAIRSALSRPQPVAETADHSPDAGNMISPIAQPVAETVEAGAIHMENPCAVEILEKLAVGWAVIESDGRYLKIQEDWDEPGLTELTIDTISLRASADQAEAQYRLAVAALREAAPMVEVLHSNATKAVRKVVWRVIKNIRAALRASAHGEAG